MDGMRDKTYYEQEATEEEFLAWYKQKEEQANRETIVDG